MGGRKFGARLSFYLSAETLLTMEVCGAIFRVVGRRYVGL